MYLLRAVVTDLSQLWRCQCDGAQLCLLYKILVLAVVFVTAALFGYWLGQKRSK